jgi:DNA anti-recombination protein RmuC
LPVEFEKQSSLLEAIKTSLAGDGDASVTTQLAKVRIDMKDSLSELDKHNKQYFDELNNNNKQYLGAINKNIKDGFDNQNTVLFSFPRAALLS